MPIYEPHGWLRLQWQTDSRYYIAEITQDLWGDWRVTRRWGGRSSKRGNSMTVPAASYADALEQMERIGKRRQQRGYQPVT